MRLLLVSLFILAGCASTAMKGFVGQPIEEAFMRYGKPQNVFDLPEGKRAYQFLWGGGSAVLPGYSNSTITSSGNYATVNTVTTPATIIESAGCLVTLIAEPVGGRMIVRDYRIPKQIAC